MLTENEPDAGDVEALADVLARHQRRTDETGSCICGAWPPDDRLVAWPTHLATALAGVVADAYQRGYGTALSKPEVDRVRAEVRRDTAERTRRDIERLEPTEDTTPPGGLPWRDGLDHLDALLDDCAQSGEDCKHFVRVCAVRDLVAAVRRFEDGTDESIRQACWEDAVTDGETWAIGGDR